MTVRKFNLLVQPLFCDALSGEFTQPNDPEGLRHTLGKLAYAAFIKGELGYEEAGVAYPHFTYSPSWASNTTMTLHAESISPDTSVLVAKNLFLEVANDDWYLDIYDHSPLDGELEMEYGSISRERDSTSIFPLALGAANIATRNTVTLAAQEFFQHAHDLRK